MKPALSSIAAADAQQDAKLSVAPFGPAPSSSQDRLTTTLFLVALLHGILIIGVSFSALVPPQMRSAPTLEVLLLASPGRSTDNADAAYLAQSSQDGAGTTTEAVRAASPESSLFPAAIQGTAQGTGVEHRESVAGNPAREVLSSRNEQAQAALQSGLAQPARTSETPIALVATPPSPVMASAADDALRLRGNTVRELEIRADTRESALAPYLDGWKRKVERLGTLNYPRDARRQRMSGNPVLAVTIRADGSLSDIAIQRSSGFRELDQAALNILKLASPFDPFPAALRQKYDQLRFAYEWQFLGDDAAGNLSVSGVSVR